MNEDIKIVEVLGAYYRVYFRSNKEDPKLELADGYCDYTTREIVVRKDFDEDMQNLGDLQAYQNKILRHEIIHAFMAESGLVEHSMINNEETVDWMASQFYKIYEAIENTKI